MIGLLQAAWPPPFAQVYVMLPEAMELLRMITIFTPQASHIMVVHTDNSQWRPTIPSAPLEPRHVCSMRHITTPLPGGGCKYSQ